MGNKIIGRLLAFSKERDWEKFHTPRNLATSLVLEASEILEYFQWDLDQKPLSKEKIRELEEELADVYIYLLQLAHALGIDLEDAAHRKIDKNAKKYPVEKSRGVAIKYNKL